MATHYRDNARGRPVVVGSIYERHGRYWIVSKYNPATGIVAVRAAEGPGGFWTSESEVDSWNLVRRAARLD